MQAWAIPLAASRCRNVHSDDVVELCQRTEGEMMKYRNFGQKSLNELKEKLADMSLHIGFDIKEEVRIAFEKQVEKLRSGV